MIKFEDVSKSYKKKLVLKDVSFEIEDGEFVCLLGLSGCGKTTILKMINKLITPTEGKISINDDDISKINDIELRRKIGYVIQQTGLFPHMTVRENIELIPKLQKKDKEKINKKTYELLDMIGLEADEYLDLYPTQMSGGQQQRIGVARAFANDPDIILMDEPFSALDPITRNNLQDELLEIQSRVKKTIVFVTHDISEAIKLADRICLINEGRIQQYASPEDILKHPANDFVQNFIGKKRIWESPELIRAEDIMMDNPVTCFDNLKCFKAGTIMADRKIDSIIVINRKREFLGLLDARRALKERNKDLTVGEVLNRHKEKYHINFIYVSPEDSIIDVLNKTDETNIYTIPVVDKDNKLVGLITKSILFTALKQKYDESEDEE
ncbi:ABC transporter ATP-binding protein [Anaerofustis stercorihominis]|uniref:Quaternary amine transport ATP-binding protein n=1 Tax=Anaerofustis stercorihominis TaxID=214853 RepID=A0A3E3E0D9_9FIRM|nr:ABC transporter ATP-binding protein [Anaerofustis stercorihominis]RGD74953.1 ATP-binding cassette domain-containing protein [Anaerofustis stercorihominis]